jgi:hypothetical protein
MGRTAHVARKGDGKCVYPARIWSKNMKGGDRLGNLGVNRRLILKLFQKMEGEVEVFIWFR